AGRDRGRSRDRVLGEDRSPVLALEGIHQRPPFIVFRGVVRGALRALGLSTSDQPVAWRTSMIGLPVRGAAATSGRIRCPVWGALGGLVGDSPAVRTGSEPGGDVSAVVGIAVSRGAPAPIGN